MLIEYKIKMEKDSLTITQRVDPDSQTAPPKGQAALEQNLLPASFAASQQTNPPHPPPVGTDPSQPVAGGAPIDRPRGPGGGPVPLSSGPVTVIGPFIFLCPSHNAAPGASGVNHDN